MASLFKNLFYTEMENTGEFKPIQEDQNIFGIKKKESNKEPKTSKQSKSMQCIQLEFSQASDQSTSNNSRLQQKISKIDFDEIEKDTTFSPADALRVAYCNLQHEITQKIQIQEYLKELEKSDQIEFLKTGIHELANSIRVNVENKLAKVNLKTLMFSENENHGMQELKQIQRLIDSKFWNENDFTVKLEENNSVSVLPADLLVNLLTNFEKSYQKTVMRCQELENRLTYMTVWARQFQKNSQLISNCFSLNYSTVTSNKTTSKIASLKSKISNNSLLFNQQKSAFDHMSMFVKSQNEGKIENSLLSKEYKTNKLTEHKDLSNYCSNPLSILSNSIKPDEVPYRKDPHHGLTITELNFEDEDYSKSNVTHSERRTIADRISIGRNSMEELRKSISEPHYSVNGYILNDKEKEETIIKLKNYYDDLLEDMQNEISLLEETLDFSEDNLQKQKEIFEIKLSSLLEELEKTKEELKMYKNM